MSDKNNHQDRIRQWLEALELQSWQLEMLIAGFSTALLLRLYDPLMQMTDAVVLYQPDNLIVQSLFIFAGLVSMLAWLFTVTNLILLVVIRGLWVGTIGLRSLSRSADFDFLGFSDRFTKALKHQVMPYDRYILRLDQVGSVIFSATFLTVFILISIALFTTVLFAGMQLLIWLSDILGLAVIRTVFKRIWQFGFLLGGLLYAFDFLSLGKIKKRRGWFGWYYPLYRFYGKITLASIYRPIYYNLISNSLGRGVVIGIIPYTIVLYMVLDTQHYHLAWFPNGFAKEVMLADFYDDQRTTDHSLPTVTIPSKFVDKGFLEIFIRYEPQTDNPALQRVCTGFEPRGADGFMPNMIAFLQSDGQQSPPDRLLACMRRLPLISIDDRAEAQTDIIFATHPASRQRGLLATIDVSELARGRHTLLVEKKQVRGSPPDTLVSVVFAELPFWKL